jgi:hypothetical protein
MMNPTANEKTMQKPPIKTAATASNAASDFHPSHHTSTKYSPCTTAKQIAGMVTSKLTTPISR